MASCVVISKLRHSPNRRTAGLPAKWQLLTNQNQFVTMLSLEIISVQLPDREVEEVGWPGNEEREEKEGPKESE